MKKYILSIFCYGFLVTQAMAAESGFLNRVISVQGEQHAYQVYVPDHWTPEKKWPVVLFLHGAGERGSDGLLQTDVGLPQAIRKNKTIMPAIVVMPQCRTGGWWSDIAMEELAMQTLQSAVKEFNGDRSKLYLTGLSMGGYGVWNIGAKHRETFAALVSVSGRLKPAPGITVDPNSFTAQHMQNVYSATAKALAHIPTRFYHGEHDEVVPVTESRKLFEAFQQVQAKTKLKARYDELIGMPHNVWEKVFSDTTLYDWLFQQSL